VKRAPTALSHLRYLKGRRRRLAARLQGGLTRSRAPRSGGATLWREKRHHGRICRPAGGGLRLSTSLTSSHWRHVFEPLSSKKGGKVRKSDAREKRVRKTYVIEYFRYEQRNGEGGVMEAPFDVRRERTNNIAALIDEVKDHFDMLMAFAQSRGGPNFDGVRILEESSGEILFRLTTRENWLSRPKPPLGAEARSAVGS
jgi:hypothetical protein